MTDTLTVDEGRTTAVAQRGVGQPDGTNQRPPLMESLQESRKRHAYMAGFSLREAMRLMAAVPLGTAQQICRTRNHIAHHGLSESIVGFDDRVKHSLTDGSALQQVTKLRKLAEYAPRTHFAQVCRDAAERLNKFISVDHVDNDAYEAIRKYKSVIIEEVAQYILQTWHIADETHTHAAQLEALSAGNPRARRVLKAARIPMWVVSALSELGVEDLRSVTAEDLMKQAGLGKPHPFNSRPFEAPSQESLLADAESALRLVRILTALRLEPAEWRALLEHMASRENADEESRASRVEEVPVPPRPCHPPGEIVLSGPRVPRAPGEAGPRRRIDRDRSRLQRYGRRGGRLTV